MSAAEHEVRCFEPDSGLESAFRSASAARSWKRRVECWVVNLRRDLESDSLLAPGQSDRRWLLFQSSSVTRDTCSGNFSCALRKRCARALSRVSGSRKEPQVQMPDVARANGMWHGPDVKELKALTYCEGKVINLARVYVSIKRVCLIVVVMLVQVWRSRLCIIRGTLWPILRILTWLYVL